MRLQVVLLSLKCSVSQSDSFIYDASQSEVYSHSL